MIIYLELFFTFFKIGLFTIGGGYAMIPMITQEVTGKGWLDMATVTDFIGISESTPGAFALNISTFVGMDVGGFFGAICSTAGLVTPSFVIIFVVARFLNRFFDSTIVKGAFRCVKPVVVALICTSFINITYHEYFADVAWGDPETLKAINFIGLGIGLILFVLTRIFKKIPPIAIIVIGAALGAVGFGVQSLFI